MAPWVDRHRDTLKGSLEPGETLRDAARVIVTGRRPRRGLPAAGFVLALTDRRLVALATSTWLARPGRVITSWDYADGALLSSAPFGRLRLVLPDRTVVTLAPYGFARLRHLVR